MSTAVATNDEIWHTVKAMNPWNQMVCLAYFTFYTEKLLRGQVVEAVKEFFRSAAMMQGINDTFIVLNFNSLGKGSKEF